MSIKLLPASVNPVDPSPAPEVAASLAPLTQTAITTRAGRISIVPTADAFPWSPSARRGQAKFIHGTPVEAPQGDETGQSRWEYLAGWAWSHSVESTAVAHYLFYGAGLASWRGQLIDLYA